jgi:hypothetical protein
MRQPSRIFIASLFLAKAWPSVLPRFPALMMAIYLVSTSLRETLLDGPRPDRAVVFIPWETTITVVGSEYA